MGTHPSSNNGPPGYESLGLNVVVWPSSEMVNDGLSRTHFALETHRPIEPERIARLRPDHLAGLSQAMSFEIKAVGPQNLAMTCTCDASMPGPMRIGAASVAWHYVDEEVSRLWTIGGTPRALFPEFMRQRRRLVARLSTSYRQLWLQLALLRSEPLFAALAARECTLRKGSDVINMWHSGPDSFESFRILYGDVASTVPGKTSHRIDRGRIGSLLSSAANAAERGARENDIDSSSLATELLFDALVLLDQSLGRVPVEGIAASEDVAWFEDCVDLGRDGRSAVDNAIARYSNFYFRIAKFCIENDLQ